MLAAAAFAELAAEEQAAASRPVAPGIRARRGSGSTAGGSTATRIMISSSWTATSATRSESPSPMAVQGSGGRKGFLGTSESPCDTRRQGLARLLERGLPQALAEETLPAPEGAAAPGTLAAPMSGKVIQVLVEKGAPVKKGQPLLILEAMKMEHTIAAPATAR